jgi:hypothetical protein
MPIVSGRPSNATWLRRQRIQKYGTTLAQRWMQDAGGESEKRAAPKESIEGSRDPGRRGRLLVRSPAPSMSYGASGSSRRARLRWLPSSDPRDGDGDGAFRR